MAEITISRETINDVLDTILENNKQKSEPIFKETFAQIRKLAQDFKNSAIIMQNYLEGYEVELAAIKEQWAKISNEYTSNQDKRANLPNEYDQYKLQRKRLREKYLTQAVRQQMLDVYDKGFMLQEILNAFIGQEVQTVIVWVGKAGIPETFISNKPPRLYMDIDSKTGKSVMRYKVAVRTLREETQSLEKQFLMQEQKDENFKFHELQASYQKIKNRYDTYKVRGGSYVLWLNPNKHPRWHGALVSSFGSINEAYASAFIRKDFNPSEVPEDDIEILMNGVLSVTNLAGALEGDISLDGIEYAVKSKGATTLSLHQLLELADEIVNKDFSQAGLQNFLLEVKQEQRNQAAPINKAIEVNLTSTVEQDVVNYIENLRYEAQLKI